MTDRESAWANPEIIELAKNRFIPVAADDWYQRRRQDTEGEFFRAFAARGDRAGDATKQGTYAVTASGKLLGYNNHPAPERRLAMLRDALKAWEGVTKAERQPEIGEPGESDRQFARKLPANALAMRVSTRALDRKDGQLVRWEPEKKVKRGARAASDHLWIREDEWRGLLARLKAAKDEAVELDQRLLQRILRFHLVDNTRGEPKHWSRDEIVSGGIRLQPAGNERWIMEGEAKIQSKKGDIGIEARFQGELTVELGRVTRWEFAALGEHWGDSKLTRGARPGRTPLGIVFALLPEGDPDRAIPPQGARWEDGYYEAERH